MNSPVHNSYAAKKPAAPFRVESEKKPKRETAKERQARYISRIDKDSLEAINQEIMKDPESQLFGAALSEQVRQFGDGALFVSNAESRLNTDYAKVAVLYGEDGKKPPKSEEFMANFKEFYELYEKAEAKYAEEQEKLLKEKKREEERQRKLAQEEEKRKAAASKKKAEDENLEAMAASMGIKTATTKKKRVKKAAAAEAAPAEEGAPDSKTVKRPIKHVKKVVRRVEK